MISFDLTDEQHLLELSVREWAAREMAPHIRDADRQHRFDRDRVLGGMAGLGLLGISVPQEYGGAGMDYICLGLASEELEYVETTFEIRSEPTWTINGWPDANRSNRWRSMFVMRLPNRSTRTTSPSTP